MTKPRSSSASNHASGTRIPRCLSIPALLVLVAAVLPAPFWVPASTRLDPQGRDGPVMGLTGTMKFTEALPTMYDGSPLSVSVGPLGYVLIVQPEHRAVAEGHAGANATATFLAWYDENRAWIETNLLQYGGFVFRGFGLKDAVDFDHVLGALHPDLLAEVYLGTTPRNRIPGTRFVSTSTEVSKFATIPTHLELPYTLAPPRRIYFFCQTPNPPPGGQTTLSDFRQVWRDLDPALKSKFLTRGLTYKRWYYDEAHRPFDPLKTKSWQSMFETTNKTLIKEMSNAKGFEVHWADNGDILLHHKAVISRNHEASGDEYLNLHFNVLHGNTFYVPFLWSAQVFHSKSSILLGYLMWAWVEARKLLGFEYGHDMVYSDDMSEVSWEDAMTLRRAISKQTWIYDHQAGDLVMLDNHRIAHGRSPYFSGPRKVLVGIYN